MRLSFPWVNAQQVSCISFAETQWQESVLVIALSTGLFTQLHADPGPRCHLRTLSRSTTHTNRIRVIPNTIFTPANVTGQTCCKITVSHTHPAKSPQLPLLSLRTHIHTPAHLAYGTHPKSKLKSREINRGGNLHNITRALKSARLT